jgi:hypothetical protein
MSKFKVFCDVCLKDITKILKDLVEENKRPYPLVLRWELWYACEGRKGDSNRCIRLG